MRAPDAAVPFSGEERRCAAALAGDRDALLEVLAGQEKDPSAFLATGARLPAALAHRAASADPPIPLPPGLRARLARAAAIWVLAERTLEDLGACLGAAEVAWAPIKGADVATRVYPDPAVRPMTDLDLLVPEASFREARRAVEASGWRSAVPGPRFERYVEEEGSAWTAAREGAPLPVELHFRLWGFVPAGLGDALLERAAADPSLGATGRRLRLADAFLLAAVHPWLHLPPRSLANWWELHLLAEAGGAELAGEVADQARRWGLQLPVVLSAAQVATLWRDSPAGRTAATLVAELGAGLRRSERLAARRALARHPGSVSIELLAIARRLAGRPSRSGWRPVLRRFWAHPGIVERLTPEAWSWPRRRAVHLLRCLGVLRTSRADPWRAPTHGHRAR
ncbi:MAG TPA: nucleotidyltransferase family protein [Thermoanaerobaculia bacterium]|nr:nucleotidyltransferase family protein [Thermoanaerobaculia bacterium]